MCGDSACGFGDAACGLNISEREERDPDNLPSCPHYPLKGVTIQNIISTPMWEIQACTETIFHVRIGR